MICFSRNGLKPREIILTLQQKGVLSASLLKCNATGYEAWLIETSAGVVFVVFDHEEKLVAEASNEKSLDYFLRIFFSELSVLCRAEPELVMVLLGDQLLPVSGSRLAAIFSRGGLGVLVFMIAMVCFAIPLSALGISPLVSVALAFSTSLFAALLFGPTAAIRALARWRLLPGHPLKIIVAKLQSLGSDVELAASFAKLSLAKRLGQLTPEAVKFELEGWGIPVREVSIFEVPNPATLLYLDGVSFSDFFLTTSRKVLAVSHGGLGKFSIVIGVDALIDLDQDEVRAVLAHELSHVKHRDSAVLGLLAYLIGLLILANLEVLLSTLPALLAATLVGAYLVMTTYRVLELRADLEAALAVGRTPVRRALIKLEYSSLVKSSSLFRRMLSLFLPTMHPPAWLRLVALERAQLQGSLLKEASRLIFLSFFLSFKAYAYQFAQSGRILAGCRE